MTGGAVAVAISVSPDLRLQEFVRELLQVARGLVDVFVDDELTHLVIDGGSKRIGGRRPMRRAGAERVRLELANELLGDRGEDAGRHVGPSRGRYRRRIEGGLAYFRAADLDPRHRV